jgi:hypothetical protein
MEHRPFGVIRPGALFDVLGVEDGWARLRLRGEPGVGYVSAVLLHRLPAPAPARPALPVAIGPSLPPVAGHRLGGEPAGGGEPTGGGVETPSQESMLRDILRRSSVDAEAAVYVIDADRMFHREGCRHLRARALAIPLIEAMMDYAPCRSCKPLRPVEAGK